MPGCVYVEAGVGGAPLGFAINLAGRGAEGGLSHGLLALSPSVAHRNFNKAIVPAGQRCRLATRGSGAAAPLGQAKPRPLARAGCVYTCTYMETMDDLQFHVHGSEPFPFSRVRLRLPRRAPPVRRRGLDWAEEHLDGENYTRAMVASLGAR